MGNEASDNVKDASPAEQDAAPVGVVTRESVGLPIANGKASGNGSHKRGKKEAAAAAARAAEATAPPAAPKSRGKRAADGMTPAERRIAEEDRERAAQASQEPPTAPEAAPGKKGGRKPKPAPEAAPTGSQEPEAAPKTELIVAEPTLGTLMARVAFGPEVPSEAPLVVGERPLTDEEAARHTERVERIHARIDQVENIGRDVGADLAGIQGEQSYRMTHPTFAAFVRHEFQMEPRSAYYLIGTAKALENLIAAGVQSLPDSQRAARPLLTIPDEHQAEVWTQAEEIAKAEGSDRTLERHAAEAARASGFQREDARRGRGRPPGSKNKPKPEDEAAGGPGAQGGAPGSRGGDPVERAKAEGVIPANATVKITETEGEPVGNSEPLTDEDWLETFPIRDGLTVATRRIFDVSALGYRAIEAARIAFSKDYVQPAIKRAEGVIKDAGPYLGMLAWALRLPHPSQWRICDSCRGTGELTKTRGQCPDCERNGFHV